MWTHNLDIHDYNSGIARIFVWDEVPAKRGAMEMCTFINKFINTFVPPMVDKLFILSDTHMAADQDFVQL